MSSKIVCYSTLVTLYKSVLSPRENVVSTDRVPVMQRVSSGHRSVRADVASSLRVTTRDNRQQWPQPFVWLTDVCAQMGRTVRVTVSPLTINGRLQNCLLRLSSSLVHTHTPTMLVNLLHGSVQLGPSEQYSLLEREQSRWTQFTKWCMPIFKVVY